MLIKAGSSSWSKCGSGSSWPQLWRARCDQPPRRPEMRWWQIKKRNADLERELRSDLELEEEEQREKGVPADEAGYAALRAFGNPTLIREQTRATWSWNWLDSLRRDLRYGMRSLGRTPGFTLIAVV